jgi:hypothetical protein
MRVKISQLKPNPSNPRVIKDEQFRKLVKSITEFPEMLDVRRLVCTPDFVVLGGNMRLKALQEAKVKEVDVEVVDWSEEKQRQFIIKDNASFGEWNHEVLANEWDVEDLSEWGVDVTIPQDWTQLEYIAEEQTAPPMRKDNVITVTVPDELLLDMPAIEEAIKSLLNVEYSGCVIK